MRGVPRRAADVVLGRRVLRAATAAGLRAYGKNGRRHKVPLMNGFRRFFNRTAKDAPTRDAAGAHISTGYMMGNRGVCRWTRTTARPTRWSWPPSTPRPCPT